MWDVEVRQIAGTPVRSYANSMGKFDTGGFFSRAWGTVWLREFGLFIVVTIFSLLFSAGEANCGKASMDPSACELASKVKRGCGARLSQHPA
jgi:hypothetical protein